MDNVDILFNILGNLDIKSILTISSVNKRINGVSTHNIILRRLYNDSFDENIIDLILYDNLMDLIKKHSLLLKFRKKYMRNKKIIEIVNLKRGSALRHKIFGDSHQPI